MNSKQKLSCWSKKSNSCSLMTLSIHSSNLHAYLHSPLYRIVALPYFFVLTMGLTSSPTILKSSNEALYAVLPSLVLTWKAELELWYMLHCSYPIGTSTVVVSSQYEIFFSLTRIIELLKTIIDIIPWYGRTFLDLRSESLTIFQL